MKPSFVAALIGFSLPCPVGHACAPQTETFETASGGKKINLDQWIAPDVRDNFVFGQSTLMDIKSDIGSGSVSSTGENGENFLCYRDVTGQYVIFSSGAMGGWSRVTSVYVGVYNKSVYADKKCVTLESAVAISPSARRTLESLSQLVKHDGVYESIVEKSNKNVVKTRRIDFSVVGSRICWILLSEYDSR